MTQTFGNTLQTSTNLSNSHYSATSQLIAWLPKQEEERGSHEGEPLKSPWLVSGCEEGYSMREDGLGCLLRVEWEAACLSGADRRMKEAVAGPVPTDREGTAAR